MHDDDTLFCLLQHGIVNHIGAFQLFVLGDVGKPLFLYARHIQQVGVCRCFQQIFSLDDVHALFFEIRNHIGRHPKARR